MSVLDKWLGAARQPLEDESPVNTATSATNPKIPMQNNEIGVADRVRHHATFATDGPSDPGPVANVARCRMEFATAKSAENKGSRDLVANVAGNRRCAGTTLDAEAWSALFEERVLRHQYVGRLRAEAEQLAWGDLQSRWHIEHGERVPRDLCAGCRRSIGDMKALDLIDGCRVHFANHTCLFRHGDRWREAAARALQQAGLRPPRASNEDPNGSPTSGEGAAPPVNNEPLTDDLTR